MLTLTSALHEMFGVQLYKNNACALLLRILSILNLDWLQHARSVRGVLSLTPWPFKPLPGLFCLNIFIGCAQKKGWYNKPRIFSLPVSPYFQSLQLPPTWDRWRWVKRFGPGDPHTPAALLSALQVSPLTPNFQTSYYFLPTRWYRWLLGLFLRFRLSPAVFLCLIGPGT